MIYQTPRIWEVENKGFLEHIKYVTTRSHKMVSLSVFMFLSSVVIDPLTPVKHCEVCSLTYLRSDEHFIICRTSQH